MPKKKSASSENGFPPQSQSVQPGREHKMEPAPEYTPLYTVDEPKLQGKVAIITGGDSGIGRAVAVLFARHGANIVIPYLEENRDAVETQQAVESEGQECLLIAGDLRDESFCANVIQEANNRFGQVDILVNNIAEQHSYPDLRDIPSQQFLNVFKTNIISFFVLTQLFLQHCSDSACVINTASVTAYRGSEHLVDYSATKGAIVSMTRSLALQQAPHGIRVNAVAPGPVWTPLIPASFPAEQVAKFGSDVPLGRAGQPNEIAPAYLFLASKDAQYMTGQVLHPNGGEIING